jgi:hypothetical protein
MATRKSKTKRAKKDSKKSTKGAKENSKRGAKKPARRPRRGKNGGNVIVSLPKPLYTFLKDLRSILITQDGDNVVLNEPLAQALCDAIGGADRVALRRDLDRAFDAFVDETVAGLIP